MNPHSIGRTIPLSETTKFIVDNRGKTAPTANTGIKLIATNCINNDHLYPQYINVRRVSKETYDTWFRAHPEPGDIILTNKGSQNGAICLVPDPVDFVIAQDMVALRANEEVIDPLFLFAALRSPMTQWQIKNLDVSGVIPHFKKTDFDKLQLPYPDMATQRAIGRIYFDFCAKMELNRRLNRSLEELAQAVFRSWFVDFDPVTAKASGRPPVGLDPATADLFPDHFQDSELGEIPKGWRVATIDDCTSLIIDYRGKTPKKLGADWSASGIPAISAKNIKTGRLVRSDDMNFVDRDLYERWMKDKLAIGDILLTSEAPLGEMYFLGRNANYCLSQRVFGLRSNPLVCNPIYLYHWLLTQSARDQLESRGTGTTVIGIRQAELRKVSVLVPPRAIQTAVCPSLRTMMDQVQANQEQNERLAAARDALLPPLLSGELRVPDAERFVERLT